jgi:uncharacterized protein
MKRQIPTARIGWPGWCLAVGYIVGGCSLVLGASTSRTALADAMEKNDIAAVRALLGDSDVNASQADGMTALHWAARHDDVATARALVAAKANPRAENRYGVTPLSLACTNGSAAMVSFLL